MQVPKPSPLLTLAAILLFVSRSQRWPASALECPAGLVESYDAEKGRYQLLVKGRVKPLGVKVACCKLEFAAEQEQREHEATRRARVEANVRAALAAREPEAETGSTG